MTEPQEVLAEALRPLLAWAEAVSQHHAMLRTEPPFTTTQALKKALASAYAALVRTPETLDAGLRKPADVMRDGPSTATPLPADIPFSVAPSPTPPEGLRTALKTFHWLAHPHGCDETKCKGALALAASPAPDPGAGLDVERLDATFTEMGQRGWVLVPDGHSPATVRNVFLEAYARLAPSAEPPETT